MSTRHEAIMLIADTYSDELLDVLLAVADKLRLYPRSSPETIGEIVTRSLAAIEAKATVSFDEEAFRYEE